MRAPFPTLTISLSLMALFACATRQPTTASHSPSPNPQEIKVQGLPKEGQKTLSEESKSLSSTSTDLNRAFNRLNDPTMRLMDEDIRVATSLHPAPKSSMEEAVLVLAQLRLLKMQTDQSSKFQAQDLYENNEAATEAKTRQQPSLERQFRDLNINLVETFQSNTYLKNLSTLAMLKGLLDVTDNSNGFREGMQSIMDKEAQKWSLLQKPTKLANPEPVAAEPATPPVEQASVTEEGKKESDPNLPSLSTEVRTTAIDLKKSDSILMMSQKLADKGDYKQAIEQAARIENRDPFFDQAKEKIKVYSNRAVQDLRQKAAQAFQNALPVADARAKAAYLKQAKDLLEQALKDFPTADQLDTVRENLSTISRDLSSLDKDSRPDNNQTQ